MLLCFIVYYCTDCIVPDLVLQCLSEELQQQEGLSAVGAVVEQTEDQHLHKGGGATLRHQEYQLGQIQRLCLLHKQQSRCNSPTETHLTLSVPRIGLVDKHAQNMFKP